MNFTFVIENYIKKKKMPAVPQIDLKFLEFYKITIVIEDLSLNL